MIMTFIWLSTAFSFYLLTYLVNTFQQVYQSALLSSMSELVGYATAGIAFHYFGVRGSLVYAFTISFIGGALMMVYGLDH